MVHVDQIWIALSCCRVHPTCYSNGIHPSRSRGPSFEYYNTFFYTHLKVLNLGYTVGAQQGANCFMGILRDLFILGRSHQEGI